MANNSKPKLESMALTDKDDSFERYVLVLCNLDIYPNKDEEESKHLERWHRVQVAEKHAAGCVMPKAAEGDLIDCFWN